MKLYAGARNLTGRISKRALDRVLAEGNTRQLANIKHHYLPKPDEKSTCADCGERYPLRYRKGGPPKVCGPCGRKRWLAQRGSKA